MSEPDEEPAEPAPEGAHCAEHPERLALVTCPRCGSYCCIACWQSPARRCHACLLRDPGPPVPWADPERTIVARFLGTLGGAFAPRATAAAFTRGSWRRAISFALLTFLPLSMLSGIVPFTHTLGFGPSWRVIPLGAPDGAAIALDVAGAMGLGVLVASAKLALLTAAFVSLAGSYGKALESEPGRQVVLYRAWLLPFAGAAGILLDLMIWGLPVEPSESMLGLAQLLSVVPLVMLFASYLATARQAYGIGPFASFVVVAVPFVAMFAVEPLLFGMLQPLLPSSESMREAAEAAGALP